MQGPSAAVALDLWEGAQGLGPVERALALAAAAGPPAEADELAALPLGRRDARLLRLRAELVGERLEATATCPACGERIEFGAEVSSLLSREDERGRVAPIESDGFVVEWRPPDSNDLASAAATGAAGEAERVLLARCVRSASGPDGALEGPELPPAVREAVAEAMAAADPLAEVLIDLGCPACQTQFVADLDASGFVWAEVCAHARRLLREIDALARAYGWSEAEVLALGERRRAAYLDLAGEEP